MKKLISTLTFVLGVVALSFGQDASNTASTQGADALVTSKTSGTYVYTLPSVTTDEQVSKAASYYTDFFTVSFDTDSREATLDIIGERAQSTMIANRFLSACGARFVNVDGKDYKLHEYYEAFVK